jgi:hypothetical protein
VSIPYITPYAVCSLKNWKIQQFPFYIREMSDWKCVNWFEVTSDFFFLSLLILCVMVEPFYKLLRICMCCWIAVWGSTDAVFL